MTSLFSRIKLSKLSRTQYVVLAIIVLFVGKIFLFPSQEGVGDTFLVSARDFPQQVSVSGSVIAARDADLGFATSGRISGVYAHVGQRVLAGTIIAEIENGDWVATLAQRRFALKEAEAKLATLRSGTRSEELVVKEVAVASAEVALRDAVQNAYTTVDDAIHNKVDTLFANPRTDAKLSFSVSNVSLKLQVEARRAEVEKTLRAWEDGATASNAQKNLATITSFLAEVNAAINQGVPDQTTTSTTFATYSSTLATARTNVQTAIATLTSAQATYISADAEYKLKLAGATVEDIRGQEAAVAGAEAQAQSALSELAKTRVIAPFSGIVTRMDAKVGEIVSPTESLIGMQSDGLFQIETFIPEVAITRIALGNMATTTLDAYGSSASFRASVVSIDPAETVKDGVPAYKTTLAFLDADARIRSGMTANVLIETGILPNAIVIPSGAVGRSSEQYVTVVVDGDPIRRTVMTGPSPALGQAHILSGLSAGEVILLSPVP
jgi:RND family efflux transporter MFP subunit